jgi:type IV secretory pathway TrbF-like protein
MATATTHSQEITRAAERYLEQYGDPLVMNTYLKVTILALSVVCVTLAGLLFRSQKALANLHPMIVRINDVGRAEAIDYRNFQYRPQEAENKYYLTRWAELYFSRNRFTIERDQSNSLYFLNDDVQRAVINLEQKDSVIQSYARDSTLPFVDVEVKNVVLDDLRQSPYSARIEFEKVFTNPSDHTEIRRERWTASVTYVFRENVKNNELAVNPLGLTIVRFRADQAFN